MGAERPARDDRGMSRRAIARCLLACCLLLALSVAVTRVRWYCPRKKKKESEKSESVNKGGNE